MNLYHRLSEDKEFRNRFKNLVNDHHNDSLSHKDLIIKIVFREGIKSEDSHETYLVFSFEGKFYRLNGWASSYGDSSYEDILDFFEVKPVTKTITVWE